MDREIPKEVRNKERNKKIIRYGAIGVAGIVVVSVLISLMRAGVKEKDLVFSKVGKGTIEVSVSASGKVVPAFEEIINSPINTRILEVYRKGGDSVDVGTPILKLDLQSAETDYKKMLDEEQMRSYKLKQLKLDNQTKLTDLQMKIKVSAMKLDRMKVELRIDPGCSGVSVVINAPALTDEVKALAARLEGGGVLVGWQGGRAVPLAAEDILRCYGEEKGVKCQTPGGVYDLKERLYELEGRLDRHTFVRISHSEIISLRKITALDLSLTGTIRVTLEGGAVSYVSRRYVRKIKEALGL